ncbi:hypothetical protein PTKIN_Ptkin06aG0130100 [Pterospermum kingtungense]
MKMASWNIRGLGRAKKKRPVRRFLNRGRVDFLAIQETKLKEVSSRLHRWLWGNEPFSSEVVVSDGNSGGLISDWKNDFFEVDLKFASQRFILLIGMIKGSNFKCGFGDFNIVRTMDEKMGLSFNQTEMDEFSGKCGHDHYRITIRFLWRLKRRIGGHRLSSSIITSLKLRGFTNSSRKVGWLFKLEEGKTLTYRENSGK